MKFTYFIQEDGAFPIGESRADSSGQGGHQKSPEPGSSELVSSLAIDANPKLLRLQCSCGQIIELIHTQNPEGTRLSLYQPSSQTSETVPLRIPRAKSEELRNALFGEVPPGKDVMPDGSGQSQKRGPSIETPTKEGGQ